MTAEPVERIDPIRTHRGPWTEDDYLALGEDQGQDIELVDGSLIVSPHGDTDHQRVEARLWRELEAQLPDHIEALHEVNVRLRIGRLCIPDVTVTRDLSGPLVHDAADVALIAEVESPHGKARDRILKPALYAEAGIPWYLRIVREPALELILYRENDGSYEEHSRASIGASLALPDLDASINVDALLRRR